MDRKEVMEIYKDRASKFQNTQSIQWKMNLSIWTLLVLAIFRKENLKLPECTTILILSMLVGVHLWYCVKTQRSLDFDKKVNNDIIKQLNDIEAPDGLKVKLNSGKSTWPWVLLQVVVTIILAMVFYFEKH